MAASNFAGMFLTILMSPSGEATWPVETISSGTAICRLAERIASSIGTSAENPDMFKPTSIMDAASRLTTEISKYFSGRFRPLKILSAAGKTTSTMCWAVFLLENGRAYKSNTSSTLLVTNMDNNGCDDRFRTVPMAKDEHRVGPACV